MSRGVALVVVLAREDAQDLARVEAHDADRAAEDEVGVLSCVAGGVGLPQQRTFVRAVYELTGAESLVLGQRWHSACVVGTTSSPPGRIATPISRAPLPSSGSM